MAIVFFIQQTSKILFSISLYHTAINKSRTAGLSAVLGEVYVYASEVLPYGKVKFEVTPQVKFDLPTANQVMEILLSF
jgi:hypothetical protein